MRPLALLFVLPILLTAQSGGGAFVRRPTISDTDAPPTKPEDLCVVEGQVLDAATGEPVRKATVLLTRTDPSPGQNAPPQSYTAASTAGGQFSIKDIEPGKYRLSVNRNGYVALTYGARGPMRPGTTLSLIRAQRVKDISLKLTPHAIITGRVVDEDGEAVANARVMLQAFHYANGRKQLMSTGGGASTNDLGEYRIFGVAPGKYYLSVAPVTNAPGFAIDGARSAGPDEDYVTTYYPGTIDPAAAAQLEVPVGGQMRGIDIALSKARTVHVKGRVATGSTGRQNAFALLLPRNAGGIFGPLRNFPIDPSGKFDIRGVVPGAYVLVVSVNDANSYRQGRMPIDVGAGNVEGVQLAIAPGADIKGRVRPENDSGPLDLTTVRISLQSREPNSMMFGGGMSQLKGEEGAFEIKSAAPDLYNVLVSGLPAGSYVKSIRSDQVDVLASGLDLTNGAAAPLDIVISPKAASVTGTAQNPDSNNPTPGAMIVLVPQEKDRRDQPAFYRNLTADQHGAFSFTGVPPGEYRAYAWEDVETGAYMDPDFMKPFADKGEALTLRESDQKNLTLKVIRQDAK